MQAPGADHDRVHRIEFKLANSSGTIFLGRYEAAENRVYVEDPDHPGIFLGGFTPGAGQPIETKYVILDVPKIRIFSPPSSAGAVLDITWNLTFKPPTFLRDYAQLLNIGYRAPQASQTGFFQVGNVSVGYRTMLPSAIR